MGVSPGLQYGEVAVGLVDSVVLPGNANRLSLIVSNPGPNTVWIAWGQAATVNKSIALPPNSNPLILHSNDWPGLLAMDLHAVTVNAAGNLAGLSRLLQFAI